MGTGTEPAKLTPRDPVDLPTLKRIGDIQGRRGALGDALVDLELEKVKILVEARRLDEERAQIFARILTARGLKVGVAVEIDPRTGLIELVTPQASDLAEPEPGAPPAPPGP